jgi:hypothetical protein
VRSAVAAVVHQSVAVECLNVDPGRLRVPAACQPYDRGSNSLAVTLIGLDELVRLYAERRGQLADSAGVRILVQLGDGLRIGERLRGSPI